MKLPVEINNHIQRENRLMLSDFIKEHIETKKLENINKMNF